MTDTTNPQAAPEIAHALLRRHGLSEDVIDGALCLHAQELAAQQRAHADAEPGEPGCWHDGAHCVADLIDPTKAAAASVPASAPTDEAAAPTAWVYEQVCTALNAHREKAEVRRLALAAALRLDTGAPWDTIRSRVAKLAVDRATIQASALRDAATRYATLADQNEAYDREHGDLDEAARIQHGTVRDVATGLRRMADEVQQATSCSARPCNAAADELCDAHAQIRYHALGEHTFCDPGCDAQPEPAPPVEPAPSVEHCIHDRTVHRTHHKTAPVTGCPWCTTASAAEEPS
jgi:hypothetical protein